MTTNPPPLSVMLVDDHLIVRRGLASLIGDEPDLTVVAEAGSGEEAIALAAIHRPDVIVLDLRLRDMSGIDSYKANIKNPRPFRKGRGFFSRDLGMQSMSTGRIKSRPMA